MATGTQRKPSVAFELLWTNPNPSADFAAQTVAIANITDYDAVAIEPYDFTNVTIITQNPPAGGAMIGPAWKTAPSYRSATIVSSPTVGVEFTTCYIGSGTSTSNSVLKPYRIYGIKGIS